MLQISEIKRFHQLSVRSKKIHICANSPIPSTKQNGLFVLLSFTFASNFVKKPKKMYLCKNHY